jgi:phosphoglycolate phosphatase-like HAD superfamily hydrolase
MSIALYWDIDGTLLNTGGLGAPILESAFEKITGFKSLINKKSMSGMTDYEIVEELANKVDVQISDTQIEKILVLYTERIKLIYESNPPKVFQNTLLALKYLEQDPQIFNFLASGNCKVGGLIKLEAANLSSFFPSEFCFFSSLKNKTRMQILAEVKMHSLGFDSAIVVGDSPRDIVCAKKNGLSVLALDSGQHNSSELRSFEPDFLLSNPWDIADFLQYILS